MPVDDEGDERCTGREELPINDFMTRNGRIRGDTRLAFTAIERA